MNSKTPFIRLAKRENIAPLKVWLIRLSAFVLALLIGMIIYASVGADPGKAFSLIFFSPFKSKIGRRQILRNITTLLGTSLALAPCFRMRYWNIGAEGQITMGAMAASFFALRFANRMASPLLLIVMALAAMAFGAVWAGIPAFFKAHWNTNETLFTLMLNYIAIGIVAWLQGGPWEGVPGSQIIPMFSEKALLPKVMGVHIGWIIVLVLVFVMFVYLKFTKHGYEIAVLGESENTARYAGMNVRKITVRTVMFSGAICGLVGYFLASGANGTLNSAIAGGVGFTAITVAWLSQLNPFAMVAVALLIVVLEKGAGSVYTSLGVPSTASSVITGIILLCMLGCEFFINYRLIFRNRKEEKANEL